MEEPAGERHPDGLEDVQAAPHQAQVEHRLGGRRERDEPGRSEREQHPGDDVGEAERK